MKKYLMMGVAAAALASCSHDMDYYDENAMLEFSKNQIVEKYNQAFIETFGQPAANQDWGFGSATRGLTRAAATWDGNHSCAADWSKLNFTKPEGAIDLTRSDLFPDGNNLGSQFQNVENWYIPADFNGSLSLHNMNLKGNVYILGKLTDLQQVNYNGTVTFYVAKDAKLKYTVSSGNRHNIINAGELEVAKWSNVGELYNGGTLKITDTDVHNDAKIYSNGDATIEFPNGGDLKSTCDIHGTIKVTGNLKIQNSTSKYICGIDATGTVENVDGPFYTSYVKADKFTVDGNETYLLAGGHIKANTVHVYNSGCSIKAAAGSTALIEAKDFIFANDNDFERTVSDNVYFQISGSIDMTGVTNGSVKEKRKYNNASDYIAVNGNPNNKLNSGTATGSPACGNAWSVGNTTTPDPDPDTNWTFVARVFAEDLSASTGSDFDFNDVVFDVYNHNTENNAKLVIRAAGGTLPLTVAGKEVHAAFAEANPGAGINTSTMINTGGYGSVNNMACPEIPMNTKYNSMADVKGIQIAVEKTISEIASDWFDLTAEVGKPAAKFAVSEQIDWCNERQYIEDKYTGFGNWVRSGASDTRWW